MRQAGDQISRWVLIALLCLTAGKFAYYSVEQVVKPGSADAQPVVVRVKEAPPASREALNLSAEERKADRLR